MRVMVLAVAAAVAACAVSTADAAPRKRAVPVRYTQAPIQPGPGATTIVSRDETGRTRTKILVQRRSYLDGGTEVMPGDVSSNRDNLINSFSYNSSRSSVSNDSVVPARPINDPFFLPGKNNPFFN